MRPGREWRSRASLARWTTTSSHHATKALGPQGPVPTQFLVGDKAWGQAGSNVTPAAPAVTAERQLADLADATRLSERCLGEQSNCQGREGHAGDHSRHRANSRVVGTISADHVVEKVESWIDNPVLGDMHVETSYSDYRDFGGFRFPAKMVQKQGGFPVFELNDHRSQG